jgi:alpha-glucosidase
MEKQQGKPGSTLEMYREAIALRASLLGDNTFKWITTSDTVLHYERNDGWQVITNFGDEAVAMPEGDVLICSTECDGTTLPGNATAWLTV